MRQAVRSAAILAVLATACSGTPEPGVDVFMVDSVTEHPSIVVDAFVENAVSVDSCVLSAPGVADVAGSIDVSITGVLDDGAIPAELVVEITLGDTILRTTLVGSIERPGTYDVEVPFEEIQGTEAAEVIEGRIGADEFAAACRARMHTQRVKFLEGPAQPMVAGPGVTPRDPG